MSQAAKFNLLINTLISVYWFVLAVGIVRVVILNWAEVKEVGLTISKLKKDKWLEPLKVFWPMVKYIVYGSLLSWFSYAVTSYLYGLFPQTDLAYRPSSILATDFYQLLGFACCVSLFTLSGYSLVLSSGSKWFVNLSKLLATIAIMIIIILVIAPFLP